MKAPCPNCGLDYSFDERSFGRPVHCGLCNNRFRLPTQAEYALKTWLTVLVGVVLLIGMLWGIFYLHRRLSAPDTPIGVQAAAQAPEISQKTGSVDDGEEEAAAKLKRARELLAQGHQSQARELLTEIIKDFPSTRSAKEAQQLLDQIPKDVAIASSYRR